MTTSLPRAGYKPREIAEMFGLDYDFVLEQIHAGAIPADQFGTTYRIPNAWVQERRGSEQIQQQVETGQLSGLVIATVAAVLNRAAQDLTNPQT